MGSGGTEIAFNGGRPQIPDVAAVAAHECERLTRSAEEMQRRFADQGELATALIMQQQIIGCRLMRDAIQSRYSK